MTNKEWIKTIRENEENLINAGIEMYILSIENFGDRIYVLLHKSGNISFIISTTNEPIISEDKKVIFNFCIDNGDFEEWENKNNEYYMDLVREMIENQLEEKIEDLEK